MKTCLWEIAENIVQNYWKFDTTKPENRFAKSFFIVCTKIRFTRNMLASHSKTLRKVFTEVTGKSKVAEYELTSVKTFQ